MVKKWWQLLIEDTKPRTIKVRGKHIVKPRKQQLERKRRSPQPSLQSFWISVICIAIIAIVAYLMISTWQAQPEERIIIEPLPEPTMEFLSLDICTDSEGRNCPEGVAASGDTYIVAEVAVPIDNPNIRIWYEAFDSDGNKMPSSNEGIFNLTDVKSLKLHTKMKKLPPGDYTMNVYVFETTLPTAVKATRFTLI